MIFSSNNRLHNYLRFDCRQNRNFLANDFKFLTTQFTYSTKIFFIVVIEITFISSSKFSIINFNVDVFKNLDIEYEFRDWIYVKNKIIFTKKSTSNDVCFDIETKIIFANSNFFRRQNFNISIRQIIISLTMRELEIIQRQNSNYIIVSIYFANTKKKFLLRH